MDSLPNGVLNKIVGALRANHASVASVRRVSKNMRHAANRVGALAGPASPITLPVRDPTPGQVETMLELLRAVNAFLAFGALDATYATAKLGRADLQGLVERVVKDQNDSAAQRGVSARVTGYVGAQTPAKRVKLQLDDTAYDVQDTEVQFGTNTGMRFWMLLRMGYDESWVVMKATVRVDFVRQNTKYTTELTHVHDDFGVTGGAQPGEYDVVDVVQGMQRWSTTPDDPLGMSAVLTLLLILQAAVPRVRPRRNSIYPAPRFDFESRKASPLDVVLRTHPKFGGAWHTASVGMRNFRGLPLPLEEQHGRRYDWTYDVAYDKARAAAVSRKAQAKNGKARPRT